jgi:hypothetical protein
MRWLVRIFLLLTMIGLAWLALWPHLPRLEKEAHHLYETWQSLRNPEPEPTPQPSERIETATAGPRRQLPPPKVVTTSDTLETDDAFIREARQRAKEDPAAAMEWLQDQSSGSQRLRGMLEVVALWAADDSEAALLWLESHAQGLARLETISNGVELWATRNPTATADWIDGMANDGSKVTAAKALAAKWVENQPEEAAAWVTGLPTGPLRDEASLALAEAWAAVDPRAASIWAFGEAEFNGNEDLLHATIREFSQQSPQEAESFVRELIQAGKDDRVLSSYLTGRAEQDPLATAEWLTNLTPDDPIYSAEYANGLMRVWAESDSIAASQWLSQQPPSEQRDAAVYGFSESIQRFEPEAAAAWANTIDHPDRRVMRLQESVLSWARTQPAEALEWIKAAELEPSVRSFLADQIGAD